MTQMLLHGLPRRPSARDAAPPEAELIVDNFAGGGGASRGIEAAIGRAVDLAINHDLAAVRCHQWNHPQTRHCCEDLWKVAPRAATRGRPVGLAWFSPDYTHFSAAKGGRPVRKRVRSLAWIVLRWAAEVRPRVIFLENVREFAGWGPLTRSRRPDPRRKGETFARWLAQLRGLGYRIEWRELNAADYGAPTLRRRLFLVARRDGEPIVWPEATHAPRDRAAALGRRPWRAAAECIDWSLPCPSIFLTPAEGRAAGVRRPLAENTMKRIAVGLKRYVIDAAEPFIVTCNHGGDGFRGQGLAEPMKTVTAARDAMGLCVPYLAKYHSPRPGQQERVYGVGEPLRTADTSNRFALVAAFLAKHYGGVVGHGPERPIGTVTATDHHSLVTAHLLKNNAGSHSAGAADPLHTVTTGGRHGVVAAHLTKFYGTAGGADARAPMPTVTGGGYHVGEVRAFLLKYYGTATGQAAGEPLHTVTGRDRFGLVTVAGERYRIADIGLRMLTPRELLRAQFGEYADDYILTGSKAARTAMIGNSVCPHVVRALVAANYTDASAAGREGAAG